MADDTYTVERSAVVDAPAEHVYAQLVDFHRWPAWSPWEDIDPAMQRSYDGAERGPVRSTPGRATARPARAGWRSPRRSSRDRVEIDLRFEKPFKARNDTRFVLTPEGGGTLVTWTMTGKKTFATKVMGIFRSMDTMVGKDFEKGLARLKAVVEGLEA